MRIAVIGTGYVGLVSGVGFAELGHHVTCVDIDADRVARLTRGDVPIHEPGLPELIRRNAAQGRLSFTTSTEVGTAHARAVFIAVGTPPGEDGAADITQVLAAAREVALSLREYTVVVTKSTVPVGTSERVRDEIAAHTSVAFSVASNPEFLKEGDAVNDFLKPTRVVVGADDPRAFELMRELYRPILRTTDRLLTMDIRSAELTKYAANAMLATRISFINEIARLSEAVGADIEHVRRGIGSDPRIGQRFLFAGAGFGGSCFGKDLRALIHLGREHEIQLTIPQAVATFNERHKRALGKRIIAYFGGSLAGKRIAIWGLSFKPETDDVREAPALAVIEELVTAGASVVGYDPAAMKNIREILGDMLEIAKDPYTAATGADALVLLTEWHELRHPDLVRLRSLMRTPTLFDGRNVWSPADAEHAGFAYHGIGRYPVAT
jgi:UDPglucose 6-dehydrogenase